MPNDAADRQPTALYKALQATALEAYGSLLSAPLAKKASTAFADEANALLEGMIAEHTATLRDRIEAQLTTMTLGKGAKRKAIKAPAAPAAEAVEANGATTNGAAINGTAAAPRAAEAKAPRAAEAKAPRPAEAKAPPKAKKRGPGRASARA